jgi:hypothetical protein
MNISQIILVFLSLQPTTHFTIAREDNLMLPEHPAFHHNLTGEEAEQRLKVCGGHCHLTRFSKNNDCYILSVYKQQRSIPPVYEHYKIGITDNKKIMIKGKKEKEFDSIEDLLRYYMTQPIDTALSSIGRAYTENEYINRRTCIIL